ncbi:hypothetical protein AVEN_230185-1 [Araneus ventricosus]|uniref:Reverse transcriptase domain-containing protein n=1 Tax=Araneus ventricosus TaxID=182803 RepID=A0A4Y2LX41_ARAVE|nr:hypothetical protein AVEN_230185-1 [Araneus ventricosus]
MSLGSVQKSLQFLSPQEGIHHLRHQDRHQSLVSYSKREKTVRSTNCPDFGSLREKHLVKSSPQDSPKHIQGAFDHLQYNSIRNSLDEINFPSHTIETLKDILTDRKVTIQTAQGAVSWSQQQGCAQGSCRGPMFWNLVANEIISEEWQPNVHLQAFADDFIFVISEPTGAKLKGTAQADLTKFQHWTDKHQLKVSTEKSTTILISRLVSGPRVKWDNQIIKRSTSLKYLGVIIDNKLNWADHLINMKTKLTHLHQKITRIAGTNWGLNKDLKEKAV